MEVGIDRGTRERAMAVVDEVIDVLVKERESLSLEQCHQILDTSKEVLTHLSLSGYSGIKRPGR